MKFGITWADICASHGIVRYVYICASHGVVRDVVDGAMRRHPCHKYLLPDLFLAVIFGGVIFAPTFFCGLFVGKVWAPSQVGVLFS